MRRTNLLQIPNTDSNSHYLRTMKELGEETHPARFPADLPRFFIEFLTDPGNLVIDIFSGSNTTGRVAEELGRRWLSVEIDPKYARLSAVRFLEGENIASIREAIGSLERGEVRQIRVRAQPQTPGRKTSRQATTRQRRLKASSGQKDLF